MLPAGAMANHRMGLSKAMQGMAHGIFLIASDRVTGPGLCPGPWVLAQAVPRGG